MNKAHSECTVEKQGKKGKSEKPGSQGNRCRREAELEKGGPEGAYK